MRIAAIGMAAMLLSGCVGNKSYRPSPAQYLQYIHDGKRDVNYILSFLEFDDMGEMFHPDQLTSAIRAIEEQRRRGKVTVMIFVHGWKNNASEASGNVWGFREELASLSQGKDVGRVIGVYFGWRGKRTHLTPFEDFSYWEGFDAANRIPGAQMTDAVLQIVKAVKGPLAEDDGSKCIAVGHSFGAIVLEKTLTQAMVDAIDDNRFDLMPDLTVLLNEAGPAMLAKPLLNLLVKRPPVATRQMDGKERPLLLAMTSTGDMATKIGLPIGQGATLLFKPWFFLSLRSYEPADEFGATNQKSYWLRSTANTPALQNHEIDLYHPPKANSKPAVLHNNLFNTVTIGGQCFDIYANDDVRNRTPYWVMQIPTQFVPDHTTVFKPEVIKLLDAFLYDPDPGTLRPCGPRALPPPPGTLFKMDIKAGAAK
jgi:hypothetical protein